MDRIEAKFGDSSRRLSRRDVLMGAATALAASGLAHMGTRVALGTDFERSPEEAVGLTAYERERQVFVRWNNSVVVNYRAHASLKFPYFGPLIGPASGVPLTTESSLPYPHHRGVWLGCEPLNGGDYWSDGALADGQVLSTGPTLSQVNGSYAVIEDQCEWLRHGAPSPLKDRRKIIVRIPSERIYMIDIAVELEACDDIRIESAKHSFFALRSAADISPLEGGVLMNSQGQVGAAATYGQPASWCGYHGPRLHSKAVEGIAIFNHPDNFGGNCPWFTRDYGHLSPSPFNFLSKPWSLERGEKLALKYCVVMHAGTPQEADLGTIYREWLEGNGRFVMTQTG